MQYKYPPQSFTLFSLQLLYQRSPTVPTSAKTTNYPRTSSFTTLISNAISSTSTSHSVCIVMMLHFNSIHWDHQFYTLKFFGVLLDLNTLDDLEALFDLSKRHRRVDLKKILRPMDQIQSTMRKVRNDAWNPIPNRTRKKKKIQIEKQTMTRRQTGWRTSWWILSITNHNLGFLCEFVTYHSNR